MTLALGLDNELCVSAKIYDVLQRNLSFQKPVRVEVRWCVEGGKRDQTGERIWHTMSHVSNIDDLPMEGVDFQSYTAPTKVVSDPFTIEGQRIGVCLQIKRAPTTVRKIKKRAQYNIIMEVGDICHVVAMETSSYQGKDKLEYIVDNLRTGARVAVPWSTFLAVGTRELCSCDRQECRCVYDDFRKSKEWQEY